MLNVTLHRKLLSTVAMALFALAASAQHVALKTNALYLATATPNLGAEVRLAPKWTLNASVGYNPFTFSDNRKWRHVAVEPEVRYWLCSTFAGHFFGAQLLYSHYNAGNVKLPLGIFKELEDHRFQGDLGAVGIGYGYSWMLSRHWSLEAEAAVGVGVTRYDKYECAKCGDKVGSETRWLFMPTKLALNVVYYLR